MAAPRRPRDAHDRMVKRTFSRKVAFAIELRRVLPAELLAHVDLETLARYATERTDERLRGRISDLCFTADLVDDERRTPAFFPLEHHSIFTPLLPLRVIACATELWHEYLADHPGATSLPLVAPILFTQPPARNTPIQLSAILDVPPLVRERVPGPIEIRAYADDLSGSVLADPYGDPATLAFVELTRALLYAHQNPASLTKARLATLAPLFDVVLDQPEPLATRDMHALLTYVHAFEEGSPIHGLIARALRGRSREMFTSIADALVAKGEKRGEQRGRRAGLTEGLAQAVLGVLQRRSFRVPASVRRRVSSSGDERQLRRWLARAVTAESIDDVFDDE